MFWSRTYSGIPGAGTYFDMWTSPEGEGGVK